MFTKYYHKRIILVLLCALALSACVPQAANVSKAASLPVISPTNTAAPVSNIQSDRFDGLSSGLDNATQARIRLINMVMGAPNTDVYVNGLPAFNGGVAQSNIAAGKYSGWLYAKPGTYSVALVPTDGSIDQALFPPEEVAAVAGHRYTVAAIGQLADQDIHPLVVDETALEANLGAATTDNVTVDINNLAGTESITEKAYGKVTAENIKYGEARAWFCASGNPDFALQVNTGANSQTAWEDTGWAEPGASFGLPWFGPYPADNYDDVGNVSQGTSELNVLDFLKGFDVHDVSIDGHLATFNTLLTLIDKAGLHDQLINNGPYFLMAPTDAAFEALPQSEMDALLNDPQALESLFKAHIVDGYYPSGSLSGVIYGYADRTITNQLGKKLIFNGDNLNGFPIGPNYTVGNGNRVQIIYTLLDYK